MALRGVDFEIHEGQCVGVAGESGCGKSTLAKAILGLLPTSTRVQGSIRACDAEVVGTSERKLRSLRGKAIGYVSQDPYASCDPLRSVAHHVREAWTVHGQRPENGGVSSRLAELGIANAERRMRDRPHQWSGGMLQRASIAAATVHRPAVTVADEPTSALDQELADGVVNALRAASSALLVISHDLQLISKHADTIIVMYAGKVVENRSAEDLVANPGHPYTKALLDATPRPGHRPVELPGQPPSLLEPPIGCSFASRCCRAKGGCVTAEPQIENGVACFEQKREDELA